MTCETSILALTGLLVVLQIVRAADCPSKEDVAPCICREFVEFGAEIECDEIDDKELSKVASNLRSKSVYSFTIEDSKLGSIPQDLFKDVKLNVLVIKGSTLVALTNGTEALVGLEDNLEVLQIINCVLNNKWEWSVLRNLKKLNTLSMEGGNLQVIRREDLTKISASSVTMLSFSSNKISFVSDYAFDSFEIIDSLSLDHNKIKNVKRTMLPNPALELRWLDLGDNLLEQLPEDIFTNMPNLRNLRIDYNKILVLDEKTFSPVWEQLYSFDTSGNALCCDCRMSWLLEKRPRLDFSGECASPPELKGKQLRKLKSKDFVCYV